MGQMPMFDQQDIFTPAVNSGLSAMQTEANVNQIGAGIDKMNEEIEKIRSEININEKIADKIDEEIELISAQALQASSQMTLNQSQSGLVDAQQEQLRDILMPHGYVDLQKAEYALKVVSLMNNFYEGEYGQTAANLQALSGGAPAINAASGVVATGTLGLLGLFRGLFMSMAKRSKSNKFKKDVDILFGGK